MSSRSNWPLASFLAISSALAWSSSAAAFSTRATTSPWPRMRPATRRASNTSSAVDLLAGAQELDRQAGDRAHGQRRAAAAVAVGAGQDQAGQRQALVEGLGGAHRVLAGQARRRPAGSRTGWRCGRSRPPRPSSPRRAWCARRCRGSGRRSRRSLAADSARRAMSGADWPATIGRVSTSACLPSIASCSMAAGRRVSSEAIRTFLRSVLASRSASLAGGGGLARALQAGHQDHGRRVRATRFRPSGSLAAQHLDQAVVDDLDHLVGGPDRADHRLAGGALPWPWR